MIGASHISQNPSFANGESSDENQIELDRGAPGQRSLDEVELAREFREKSISPWPKIEVSTQDDRTLMLRDGLLKSLELIFEALLAHKIDRVDVHDQK
jgi:hypothetical protein